MSVVRKYLASTFASLLLVSVAHAHVPCDIELSRHARAVSNLLKHSLDLQVTTPQMLIEFGEENDDSDPIQGTLKSIHSLALRQTIGRKFRSLNDADRAQVRKYSLWLARNHTRNESQVSEAREETRYIFAPKPVRLPMDPSTRIQPWVFNPSTFEGRPVFLVSAVLGTADSVYLDPFNPSAHLRYFQLEKGNNILNALNFNKVFVEKNGQTFAALLDSNLALNLKTQKLENLVQAGLLIRNPETKAHASYALSTNLLGATRSIVNRNEGLADIDFNLGTVTELNGLKGRYQNFALLNENGLAYTFGENRGGGLIELYNIQTKSFAALPEKYIGVSAQSVTPILIEDQGKPILVRMIPSGETTIRLEIRDLLGGTAKVLVRDLEVRDDDKVHKHLHLQTVKIAGIPYAYFFNQAKAFWINLRTMEKVEFDIPVASSNLPSLHAFEFRGRPHFILTENKKGYIFSLEDKQIASTFDAGVDAEKIYTFTYKDETYAFFYHLHSPARLFRLTTGGPS